MMVVATLVHPPELCLAREEFKDEIARWVEDMNDFAKKLGVKVHGAYVCPNEHTFYFVLESDDYKNITAFLSGKMLTHHKGRISPVLPFKAASDVLLK
jgi:uncharacterized protein with GYD domain